MEWFRRRPKAAASAGVLAVLVTLTLIWLLVRDTDKPVPEEPGVAIGLPSPSAGPTLKELPTPSTAAEVQAAAQRAFDLFGKGLSGSGGSTSSEFNIPGLQGGSIYQYLPKHVVTMRVTSEAPIGTIGYIVPTSLRNSSGVVKKVQNSWGLTTTAYGDPDYAQLFVYAGPRGFPITCTITVDGRVTERRTTEGPYAQMICQG